MKTYKKDELRQKQSHRIVVLPDAAFAILFTFTTTILLFFVFYAYLNEHLLLLSTLIICFCIDITWLILHVGLKLKRSNSIIYKVEERQFVEVNFFKDGDLTSEEETSPEENSIEAIHLDIKKPEVVETEQGLEIEDSPAPKTIKEQVSSMNSYLLSSGFQTNFAQSFVSQMLFSKFLIVKGNDAETVINIIPHMLYSQMISLPKDVNGEFFTFLSTARANPNKPFFINLCEFEPNELDSALEPFASYLTNPNNKSVAKFIMRTVSVPTNIYFLYKTRAIQDITQIKSEINKALGIVDFSFFHKNASEEELTPVGMNLSYLDLDIRNLKNKMVFEEENWKKIDTITSLVKDLTGYVVPNKVSLRLENYLASYTSLSDDIDRIIDEILPSSLLIPGLANLNNDNITNAQKIIDSLKNDFAGSDMTRSVNAVKACVNAFNKKGD